jgi:hypothetical protein
MNATGAKTVGDAPARGKVSLSNTTGKPVTVEAGTQLADKITGTTYAIANTVEVPAGQGDTPGFGAADVVCLEPGTAGNRDVGLLSGQLTRGVYFANRETPIAGGTDKQVPVVTQADLDVLQERALADMKTQAAARSPGPDLIVLAPTIQLTQPSFSPDHQVDQEAATVTVQATSRVDALAYNPTDLRNRTADALAASAPAGYEIDRASLQLSDPVATAAKDQTVVLSVHAAASAVAVFTPENRDAIAAAIAGDDETAATAYLATVPGVVDFTIHYSPRWLPDRIPSSADRVRVETR